MLWSLKNYFQLCTWKEKVSLTFINHLLCSHAHSQVLYTCNSTQSSKQHMRDGAVWPENMDLKLLSNLPKFILLHKSHASICFFFHTTWTSGNARFQVQNLRYVSQACVPGHVFGCCQGRNHGPFWPSASYTCIVTDIVRWCGVWIRMSPINSYIWIWGVELKNL